MPASRRRALALVGPLSLLAALVTVPWQTASAQLARPAAQAAHLASPQGRSLGRQARSRTITSAHAAPRHQARLRPRTAPARVARVQSSSTVTQPSVSPATVAADAAWILTAQLPDGVIATYPDHAHLSPYLANFAAEGLARATVATGNPSFAAAAWRWLDWYAAHEDARGFVTDYSLSGGSPVSTGDMDSTDAYAGTFLSAVETAWSASRNQAQLVQLHAGITGAVSAIEATQDSDGLTWAKPSYHAKYLMDQSETYAGLRSAVIVAAALNDPALAARATSDASRMAAGVAALWDPSRGAFDWAVAGDGVHQHTDWAELYPDAMEQAWAVGYGLATPAQARAILGQLTKLHPDWDQPEATDLIAGKTAPVGFWSAAGWGFTRTGQASAAAAAAASVRAAAIGTSRAWPFTAGDAGELILLETGSLPAGS